MIRTRPALLALALLAGLVALADGTLTETFKLESVVFDADAEGNAWPTAAVTVTFNKLLPEAWLREHLRSSPPIVFDLSVTNVGRWHKKTRLTINPSREQIFATDAVYRFHLTRPRLSFTVPTIPTPKVVQAEPNGLAVGTVAPLVLVFDRPMDERTPVQVTIAPEVPLEPLWYGDRALVLQHPRLQNATLYEMRLAAGIEDAGGHPMQEAFRFSFRTVDLPTAVEYRPQGERVSPSLPVRVAFSTDVDRAAVEASFQVEPPVAGSFEWPDERTLIWRPNGLRPAQTYHVRVGGASKEGDPIWPVEWQFRTLVPPPRIIPGGGEKLVLTFDDNPLTVERAYELLDLLARYQVRAILFPTGGWAAAHPAFVGRARAEGHLICNHTYGHADLTTLSEVEVRLQILNGAGTDQCDLLRPPYAAHNHFVDAIATSLGFRIYLWNIDSRDWEGLSAREIVNLVLGAARPGGVALFHLHAPHSLEALPAIIEGLRNAGYELSY